MEDVGQTARITLLTDFGTADGYVAAMRAVIACATPAAIIDTASHEIPPGDIAAGSFALSQYWHLYPAGTVHLVVVDPGVGSQRRALVVVADDRLAVGPDNGVLTPMLTRAQAVHEVTASELFRDPVSNTFHGRDVFAPVAAWLAGGGEPGLAGPEAIDPIVLDQPEPGRDSGGVTGQIVHVDRFGNLISNVPGAWIRGAVAVTVNGREVGLVRRTYADAERGRPVAVIGSGGFLEISVRDGSAADRLAAGMGASVLAYPANPPR